MADFIRTQAYADWIDSLKDMKAQARILAKVRTFEVTGHPGDAKQVGDGVMEMRFDFGPGYRVYYIVLRHTVILLGGDKGSQVKDIRTAKEFATYWKGQKL
ncbi:MAG: type II toxin-antitoxin system RelE/ParE family toxin [Parvibaculaceae bacterium]